MPSLFPPPKRRQPGGILPQQKPARARDPLMPDSAPGGSPGGATGYDDLLEVHGQPGAPQDPQKSGRRAPAPNPFGAVSRAGQQSFGPGGGLQQPSMPKPPALGGGPQAPALLPPAPPPGAQGTGAAAEHPLSEHDQALQDEQNRLAREREQELQMLAGRAGFAGVGLSGATAGMLADQGAQMTRDNEQALLEYDQALKDQEFQGIQRKSATWDSEMADNVDLDGDGVIGPPGTPGQSDLAPADVKGAPGSGESSQDGDTDTANAMMKYDPPESVTSLTQNQVDQLPKHKGATNGLDGYEPVGYAKGSDGTIYIILMNAAGDMQKA